MDKYPWPKEGDDPFYVESSGPKSTTLASVRCMGGLELDDCFLAEAFKKVADKAIAEIERSKEDPDDSFPPIAYLYRHSIELALKHLIHAGLKLGLEKETKNTKRRLNGHDLYRLWFVARRMVRKFWPQGQDTYLNAAEGIIKAFHKIDVTGQSLRYTTDKGGNDNSVNLPEAVDLLQMKSMVEHLYNMLSGCIGEFEVACNHTGEK